MGRALQLKELNMKSKKEQNKREYVDCFCKWEGDQKMKGGQKKGT